MKAIISNKRVNLNLKLEPVKVLYWAVFYVAFMIKMIYFQYSTVLNNGNIFNQNNLVMLGASFCVLLIVSSLVFVLFNKKRYWALLIADALITILLIADIVYYRYYRCPITIPVLAQISLVAPVGDSINMLLQFSDVLFLIEFPVLIRMLLLFRKSGVNSVSFTKRLVTGLFVIAVAIGGLMHFYNSASSDMFTYDRNYVAKDLGILYFHAYDVNAFVRNNLLINKTLSQSDKQEIEEYFSSKANEEKTSNYKGIAKGKNLVMVQLESIQAFLINREINGKEITPNLNKLIMESAYFDNFYYQVGGGNTSDAEFLSNNSLYPAQQGAVYFQYPMNTYNSLPKILESQGYNTFVFHAYHPSFWNRSNMYKAVGFNRFFSSEDFVTDEVEGWGLADKSFLRQSLDKVDKSEPFYSFMITLSSHYAYGSFEDNHEFDVGEYEGSTLGNYLKAAHYVDGAIGSFIDNLKQQGLYDNSVLIFYGDHHAFPEGKSDELKQFLGIGDSKFEWLKYQKVPFILHYPGVKNGEIIETTGGQIDILPTVANLLGFDAPFAMGKDLFNTEKGYAVLRNASYITDSYIYTSPEGIAYDIKTGSVLNPEEYEKDLSEFQHQVKISDIILHKDAFRYNIKIK